jgi:predicted nuclease of predicted toxin-antitoxin system
MKLLLDECVTRKLKRDLAGHDVLTVTDAGFRGLKNGALLRAASGTFDVLITVDRNLQYQQNIRSLPIAVVIIVAGGITYDKLKPVGPLIENALKTINPGEMIKIEGPGT